MKKNDSLKDLHIGKIIKEIALQKGISSKKIAAAIHRDQKNADKIFRVNDMDIDDIVCISYLLEYNILELIAKKYLSHLSFSCNFDGAKLCLLKIDMKKIIFLFFFGALIIGSYAQSSYWNLTGNAGTTTSHFLGTTDNNPLIFRTNNVERMRILPDGNIGLGTALPIQKLHIEDGSILISKILNLPTRNFLLFWKEEPVLVVHTISISQKTRKRIIFQIH